MWPFDKNIKDKNIEKTDNDKINDQKKELDKKIDSFITEHNKDKDFESLKSDTLKEFDKKVDSLMSEHKIWLEQYQRNMKNTTENYDRRINEFETKTNIIRETLVKNIDDRKDIIESLGKVLDFDKVVKYQTSGIIHIEDLSDFRELGEGNWEIIMLAKRIKKE